MAPVSTLPGFCSAVLVFHLPCHLALQKKKTKKQKKQVMIQKHVSSRPVLYGAEGSILDDCINDN